MANADDQERGARVRVPPPLVFVAALFAGVALGWGDPQIPGGLVRVAAGALVAGLGIRFAVAAGRTLIRTGQDPKPWAPTPSIVSGGPFSRSRNPIYVGATATLIGVGLALGNAWIMGLAIAAALIVMWTAILPEEAYLENKFGDEYRAYKQRVRRWL